MARTFKGGRGNQVKDVDTREALITIEDGLREMSDSIAQISRGNIPTGGGAQGSLGVTDHGALTGLGDDDHSQYLLLAGRVGGQVVLSTTATDVPVTIKGASAQSANLLNFKDSGGNVLTSVASDGGLLVGGTGITTSTADGSRGIRLDASNSAHYVDLTQDTGNLTITTSSGTGLLTVPRMQLGGNLASYDTLRLNAPSGGTLHIIDMKNGAGSTDLAYFSSSGSLVILTSTNGVFIPTAGTFSFRNNANSAYLTALSKDTSDRLIVGETNISTIYEKPAGSTVGTWTSSGLSVTGTVSATTFSGSGASLNSIPESALSDDSILARIAGNETITGNWTLLSTILGYPGGGGVPGVKDTTIGVAIGGSDGGLYLDDSSGYFAQVNTALFSADRYITIPDQSGTLMLTGNKYTLSGAVGSSFDVNTSGSGAHFQDNTTNSKKLRFILSGATGTNTFTVGGGSLAQAYKFGDHSGTAVMVGNTTSAQNVLGIQDLTAQTGSITAKTMLTSGANSSGMFRLTFYVKTTTAGSGGDIVTVTVAYNDGSAQTADVPLTELKAGATTTAFTHDLATLNRASSGQVVVYGAASNAITFTTTVTKTGSPQYTIRARIEHLV